MSDHGGKNQPFLTRLGFSVAGIVTTWREEASFRFQGAAAVFVFGVLAYLRPAPIWWALIVGLCGAILAAELFNTALETLIDHLHPERHPRIGRAKDCAAGAVLILSIAAVAVFVALVIQSVQP